jgi:hypothetical protein
MFNLEFIRGILFFSLILVMSLIIGEYKVMSLEKIAIDRKISKEFFAIDRKIHCTENEH